MEYFGSKFAEGMTDADKAAFSRRVESGEFDRRESRSMPSDIRRFIELLRAKLKHHVERANEDSDTSELWTLLMVLDEIEWEMREESHG